MVRPLFDEAASAEFIGTVRPRRIANILDDAPYDGRTKQNLALRIVLLFPI